MLPEQPLPECAPLEQNWFENATKLAMRPLQVKDKKSGEISEVKPEYACMYDDYDTIGLIRHKADWMSIDEWDKAADECAALSGIRGLNALKDDNNDSEDDMIWWHDTVAGFKRRYERAKELSPEEHDIWSSTAEPGIIVIYVLPDDCEVLPITDAYEYKSDGYQKKDGEYIVRSYY